MPKIKTHKGAQKRFHVTGGGKLLRAKVGKSHLRRKKSRHAKGLYDEMHQVHPSFSTQVHRLIPYGVK